MKSLFINYYKLVNSNNFIKFKKELAKLLDIELSKNLKEVETVKNWINKINGFNCICNRFYKIYINSLFIHGYNHSEKGSNPSGVEFDYYDKKERRELADIIFITSFYYRKEKVLEKITFNQAKWEEKKPVTSSWKIDTGQLYLLSRLPNFSGIKGSIIPNKDYYLDNISKCLTSYGLMSKENFIFLSTEHLLTAIAGKKSVNLKDLQSLNILINNYNLNIPILKNELFYDELLYFLLKYCKRNQHCIQILTQLLGPYSTCYTNNTYNFISEYLKGNIGEIIYNNVTYSINTTAKNLMSDIIKNIKSLGTKEAMEFAINYDGSDNIKDNDNYKFSEPQKGMGVVQAKIDLGE